MVKPRKITTKWLLLILCCIIVASCNSDSEKDTPDNPKTVVDTAIVTGVDTMETTTGNTAKVVDTAVTAETKLPEASLAYAYKNKMKKGDKEFIQVNVQLDKPLQVVEGNLRNELDEQEARQTGSSDTSVVKSLKIKGYKYLLVNIDKYDTTVFKIEPYFGEKKQELLYDRPSKWIWQVTAKKAVSKSEILIIVMSEDAAGKLRQEDLSRLRIQITVAKKPFFAKYGWLMITILILTIFALLAAIWFRKKRKRELNSRIYFSYAWQNAKDTIIDKLYNSLKAGGFNVIRDKVNLEYRGLISGFMKDIGKGNIIIVSISDKYLKSRFCMFELYEIYRNCGMSKEAFVKKIFPIREEEINLSIETIVDNYADYWRGEEQKLEAIVKDKEQETTSEQFAQYEAVKRIGSEIGNLLHFLADMNSLNIELLSNNDFAEIKHSLRNAIKLLDETS